MEKETLLTIAKRIQAMADIGLLYTRDNYDRDRYHELKMIGQTILSDELKMSPEEVNQVYSKCTEYPTAKVDVRALVLNEKKDILLVQEKADSRWSLPGGWADIGKTPSEMAIQEVKEETGIDVLCKYLAAVFDKRMHPHPPEPWYVYKLIFYCEPVFYNSLAVLPAFDVLGAGWFSIDDLPSLSTDRILASQIERIYRNVMDKNFITLFD